MFVVQSQPINFIQDAKPNFNQNRRIEIEYRNMIGKINKRINTIVRKYNPDNQASAVQATRELEALSNSIRDWARDKIAVVIYNLNSDSERKWQKHSSLIAMQMKQALRRKPLSPLMKRYMEENITVLQSLPMQAAVRIQKIALEAVKTGGRSKGLIGEIQRIAQVTENKAKLIARTEVSRMTTGLVQARAEALEIDWYVWRTSEDARVRSSHDLMENVLVNWSDAPSPELLEGKKSNGNYHAGCTFNCRCFPTPLIRYEDVSWPAKVYRNGRIERMSKARFIELSAGKVPMAA